MNTSRWIPLGLMAILITATIDVHAQQPITTTPVRVKAAPLTTSKSALPKAPLLKRAALVRIANAAAPPKNANRYDRENIRAIVGLLTKGEHDDALAKWKEAATAYTKRTRQRNINALIQHVMREAYLEPNKELKMRADKVRHFNEKKRIAFAYRDELRKVEKELKQSGTAGQTVRVRTPKFSTDGNPDRPVITGRVYNTVDVESVVPELASIVVLCNHAEEESKSAGLDLQNALKKESQTYQLMSNVMKSMHDTAKASIQNVR